MAPSERSGPRAGFTLLEVMLAVAIGGVLLVGSIMAYRMHMAQARISRAKIMLATVRNEIAMFKYRTGAYPTLAASTPSLATNTDDLGDPFWNAGKTSTGTNLSFLDPIDGQPNIYTPGSTTSYNGGWVYDPTAGTFQINLDPAQYPGDPPNLW